MKKMHIIFVSMTFLFFSCKKTELPNDNSTQSLIQNAKTFFNGIYGRGDENIIQTNSIVSHQSPRLNGSRSILWDKAHVFQIGNSKVVIAPVQYATNFYIESNFGGKAMYAINEIVKLCVYSDSTGVLHSEMLSFFPDSNYHEGQPFTGIAFVDEWQGTAITKYKYEKNGSILQWNGDGSTAQESNVQTESLHENEEVIVETCSTIYGYNYSEDDPEDTYEWSESGGCTYIIIGSSDLGGGGGSSASGVGAVGGGSGINSASTIIVPGGDNVIGSIVDYFQCFSNIAGTEHVFTATVCVNQPDPGTREAWGLSGTGSSGTGNPVNVGHAFLVMTEVSPSGTITRNVGFYPSSKVTPNSPSIQGQLDNDADDTYNISLTITLTNAQFFQILNYIAQGNNSGFNYNLNTNNCTSFVINALDQASIYLPSTIGTWPNGSGNDPGDLGEDIRSMNLSSNMNRNTAYNDHPNLGSCN
jgi:hypothetical protein